MAHGVVRVVDTDSVTLKKQSRIRKREVFLWLFAGFVIPLYKDSNIR